MTSGLARRHLTRRGIKFDINADIAFNALGDFTVMGQETRFSFSEIHVDRPMPLTESLRQATRSATAHHLTYIMPMFVAPLLWAATSWLFHGEKGLVILMHQPVPIRGSGHMLALWRMPDGGEQLTTFALEASSMYGSVTRVFHNPDLSVTPLPRRR